MQSNVVGEQMHPCSSVLKESDVEEREVYKSY